MRTADIRHEGIVSRLNGEVSTQVSALLVFWVVGPSLPIVGLWHGEGDKGRGRSSTQCQEELLKEGVAGIKKRCDRVKKRGVTGLKKRGVTGMKEAWQCVKWDL